MEINKSKIHFGTTGVSSENYGLTTEQNTYAQQQFGSDTEQPWDFRADESLLHTHLAIFGGTRRGKSKLFELISRQLIEAGRGMAFIDPHSDTADDLLAYLAFHQDQYGYLCNRLHYLRPDDRFFSFDPFVYRGGGDALEYRRWLHAKIIDMMKILLRNRGETEAEQAKMTRMRTWLYNGLFAVGVNQGNGKHLPLSEMFVLLNPQHPRHEDVYQQIEPFLTDAIRADFEMLRRMRSPKQIQDFVESTFNQLRQVITPTTERIFSFDRPSIDFHKIIRENGIVLASLGRTTTFNSDEGMVLAGLIVREISEAVRTIPREQRSRYYLFIDEAQNFLGEDLQDLLKESGKYQLSCGLAVQSLDNLQQQEIDLVPAVLGQCELQITFQQRYFPHAELLAKCLCSPWLDFTELVQEVDRSDGYKWVATVSHSTTTSESKNSSKGISETGTEGRTVGTSEGTSHSFSSSSGESWGESSGTSRSDGGSKTITLSKGSSESDSFSRSEGGSTTTTSGYSINSSSTEGIGHSNTKGQSRSFGEVPDEHNPLGTRQTQGRTESQSFASSNSRSNTRGSSDNRSSTEGENWSDTKGQSRGRSWSEADADSNSWTEQNSNSNSVGGSLTEGETTGENFSRSESSSHSKSHGTSESHGESSGTSKGETHAKTALHQTRIEKQHTGSMAINLNDQDRIQTAIIQQLPKQHCLVSVGNRTFVMQVKHVGDPFDSLSIPIPTELRASVIEKLKERVFLREDYYHNGTRMNVPKAIEKRVKPVDSRSHGLDID